MISIVGQNWKLKYITEEEIYLLSLIKQFLVLNVDILQIS